jgi:hypothetical protein
MLFSAVWDLPSERGNMIDSRAKDNAGHGGSVWKVFDETSKSLEWKADADRYGDFIVGKHKGPTGTSIPFSELSCR